jgi:hypothetical protein
MQEFNHFNFNIMKKIMKRIIISTICCIAFCALSSANEYSDCVEEYVDDTAEELMDYDDVEVVYVDNYHNRSLGLIQEQPYMTTNPQVIKDAHRTGRYALILIAVFLISLLRAIFSKDEEKRGKSIFVIVITALLFLGLLL